MIRKISAGGKMLKEFKEFAVKGNVVDMAVGVIIGGAFGKIVASFIEDLIMPVIGKVIGNVDFSNLYFPLSQNVREAQAVAPLSLVDAKKIGPVFAYGNFITLTLNFAIVAFCIFLLVKALNNMKKKDGPAPASPTTKECPFCFSNIPIRATRCPSCTSNFAQH
jgi:large conductance mechanosensitive channel